MTIKVIGDDKMTLKKFQQDKKYLLVWNSNRI